MSNQCRNCGRDVNNNYTSYANAYQTSTANTKIDNKSSNAATSTTAKATSGSGSNKSATAAVNSTQITAKVMFGSVGAIKELREKEQAEKNNAARTARRQ